MPRYEIDSERSTVWIDAQSTLHALHHQSSGLTGFVELQVLDDGRVDVDAPVDGHISLPVEKLESDNPLADRELRRRLDARRFPTIDGRLESLARAEPDGSCRANGSVTLMGTTRPHEDGLIVWLDDERTLRVEGSSRFDIRDYGMSPPRILMLRVEPEVEVSIDVVAHPDE